MYILHVWGEYSDVGTGIVLGLGRSMSEASGEKAPPDTPISRLLGGTIAKHSALLKELGYDEVTSGCAVDFASEPRSA